MSQGPNGAKNSSIIFFFLIICLAAFKNNNNNNKVVSVLTLSRSALAAGPLQPCQAWQGHRVAWREGTRLGFFGWGVDCQHPPRTSFPPVVLFLLWLTQLLRPPQWDLHCLAGRWEDVCSSRVTQGGFGAGGAESCGASAGKRHMRAAAL